MLEQFPDSCALSGSKLVKSVLFFEKTEMLKTSSKQFFHSCYFEQTAFIARSYSLNFSSRCSTHRSYFNLTWPWCETFFLLYSSLHGGVSWFCGFCLQRPRLLFLYTMLVLFENGADCHMDVGLRTFGKGLPHVELANFTNVDLDSDPIK